MSPSEFRVFLARHAELLRWLHEWTIRLVIPRRFEKAKNLHLWALRDDMTKLIHHRAAEELRNYLSAKHGQATTAPSETQIDATSEPAKRFSSARFQAVARVWVQGGSSACSMLDSPILKDKLQRGEGRVEVMILPHKYLHLSSLVGVA